MIGASERGLFITIEGIDGCGKSTQAALLCDWLEEFSQGEVLRTFEPGGWDGGALLRRLLLGGVALGNRTELLLFLADRSGHLDAAITPALDRGRWVVCERYTDSTLAYQSWGRGIPLGEMTGLLDWCRFPSPDLTILLDIDVETARTRLGRRGLLDRIESSGCEESMRKFMARVAQGYREQAGQSPGRFVVVDAAASVDEVAERVRRGVRDRLELREPRA